MPPRFAYWTIIVDNQPTSFRASAVEDLLPTFNRLKAKNPSAVMMWFQSGKLWPSRLDAQEAFRARGEIGRARDPRQADRPSSRDKRPEWRPKGSFKPSSPKPHSSPKPQASSQRSSEKLEWKPKGTFKPSSPHSSPKSQVPGPEFRDRKKWRPGGDHQDPRQKYKDAKKAKWTRFKQTIRARSSRPGKKREG